MTFSRLLSFPQLPKMILTSQPIFPESVAALQYYAGQLTKIFTALERVVNAARFRRLKSWVMIFQSEIEMLQNKLDRNVATILDSRRLKLVNQIVGYLLAGFRETLSVQRRSILKG